MHTMCTVCGCREASDWAGETRCYECAVQGAGAQPEPAPAPEPVQNGCWACGQIGTWGSDPCPNCGVKK